ncbi:MAG: transglycosylase domain-containing protein [Patescibacteria group bacterium]
MAKRHNYSNEKTARNKKVTGLQRLLILIGKPFYLFISYSLLFTTFGIYSIGNLILKTPNIFFKNIKKLKIKKVKFKLPVIRIKKPRIKIPKFAVKIPKKKIQIEFNFKVVSFIFFIFLILFSFWFLILRTLPSPYDLTKRDQEISTKIYDRNGTLLYKIYKDVNRTPVGLSQIPSHAILATLAAEDAEFYIHPGFSIKGITRAIIKNIKEGKLSGGSTITQQLVKNALLTPEKTVVRKIKELILSIAVEIIYSKDQILEMYLNEVSYGGTAYGIQEASQLYFGKDIKNINLSEAALLASLPKSPSKYTPFGNNPELVFDRQKDILNLMVINKFITPEESQSALEKRITFIPNKVDIKAPHFVMYVKEILAEEYGEEMIEKGGLEVTTTLDYEIQKMAEETILNEISKLGNYHVTNAASLVINPNSGEILAMVGSKDYFDIQNGGNFNVTTALRQPGSAIKVVNYAYALEHGYTLATILNDSAVSFSVAGSPIYSPKNYDGKFRGKISLRNALAESRNIPAVKVLASLGVTKMIEQGTKMGITTWFDSSNYGLSLTLGGGEVKLIDLAQVYSVVANHGQKAEIFPILEVKNSKGKILENNMNFKTTEKVLDPRVAFLLIDVLKDNKARTPAFGPNSQLVIKNHPEVAVKTGTSNNLKDNLTVGFNQDFLVAVWVGNNDSSSMSYIASGVTGAAPIFNKIMTNLLKDRESVPWEEPVGLVKISICSLTGTLPCTGCPSVSEYFLEETKPTNTCIFIKPEEDKSNILESGASTEI